MIRNRRLVLGIISLVVVTSVLTFSATAFAFYGWERLHPRYDIQFDPSKVSSVNINKFNQVRNLLEKNYYSDVNENTLVEGAIAGMADSLRDPYTVYFTKEQMQMFKEDVGGSYVGIGVSINLDKDGLVTVVEPFANSPAQKAGVQKGDKILKVDDKDVTGMRDENLVVKLIRGPEGSKVKISFFRPSEGRSLDIEMPREKIKIENIKSEMLPGNIGYIRIIKFDAEIADYFNSSLNSLQAKGMKGLIIDVRDNPGGYYDQVAAIADRLLPKGTIVYTEDKYKRRSYKYSDDKELGLPMAVLTNGNSASASEILAGAIKDYKKGTLVGTKTFGKGVVQVDYPLDDGSGLKVTIARYFTPSGVCIQGIGIQPDIEVQAEDKYANTPVSQIPKEDDNQLKKAIDIIKNKTK